MPLDWETSRDLGPYIDIHLAYELKYLLVTSTTWTAVRAEGVRAKWPDHLVVIALESAFVHTRTICEFLRLREGWSKDRSPHRPTDLPLWTAYESAMHMKVLHPDPRRPYQPGEQAGDDLQTRVVDLAGEALRAWDEVADQPEMAEFRPQMMRARITAVAEAAHAARRLGVARVFA